MLARAVAAMPQPGDVDGGLGYEPKWDGFRGVVFRDADRVEIYSRARSKKEGPRPLARYFPEVVAALADNLPARCVLDGEIVLAVDSRLDFTALQQRLHPAASRIAMLAETTPAQYIAFDLLALDDRSYLAEPFSVRRHMLMQALTAARPPVHVTPLTTDPAVAQVWFDRVEGAGLDGVVAKPLSAPYQQDKRAMFKVKHARTADVVVAGYRLHKASTPQRPLLGSLLLGLYDDAGRLQHVGVAASFPMTRRAELHDELQPLVTSSSQHPWHEWSQQSSSTADDAAPARRPGATA